jgi:hypothetical protein
VVITNVKVNSNDAPNAINVAKIMALLFVGAALAILPRSRDVGTGTFPFSWHKYDLETNHPARPICPYLSSPVSVTPIR